jgi:hypothetical protein
VKNWIRKWYRVIFGIIVAIGIYCVLYYFFGKDNPKPTTKTETTIFLDILKSLLTSIFTVLSVYFIVKVRKEKKLILKEIDNRIKISIKRIKCSSYGFGLMKKKSHIKSCDIYITDDALILFTNGSGSPIILTHILNYSKFHFADIHNRFNFAFNEYVVLKSRKDSIGSKSVKIKLKTLTDIEKKALQRFAYENCFTIIHHK